MAPIAVQAADKTLTITWDANTEDDMDHYLLFVNGTETTCPHPPVPQTHMMSAEGEYCAYLIAVDHAGNQSVPSDTACYTLDLPPAACGTPVLQVVP
jgi:hypothetical protein